MPWTCPDSHSNGATAAHDAAGAGQLQALQFLLLHHPELAGTPMGRADALPIHVAAMRGCHLIVQHLVESGFNKAVEPTSSLNTPLHLACEFGAEYVAEVLLNFSEAWDLARFNDKQLTPFHVAAAAGHARLVQLLGEAGFKINTAVGVQGLQAVHMAAGRGHTEVVHYLVEAHPFLFFERTTDGATAWWVIHAGATD